jgi:hypothetical protein
MTQLQFGDFQPRVGRAKRKARSSGARKMRRLKSNQPRLVGLRKARQKKAARKRQGKGKMETYVIKLLRVNDIPPDGKHIRRTDASSPNQALKAMRIAVNAARERVPESFVDMKVLRTEPLPAK